MARQPDNKSADKSAANLKSDDSALIRELALLLDETSLTEIEIERSGLRVRVARNITVSAAMPAGFQPFEIGTDYVTGIRRTDGVNQVVIYDLSARGR